MTERAFEQLHPAVQYHVVNSLGWKTLRPHQLAAIEPILSGSHCMVLAPTAGGKTEAAIIPVLSRMLAEDWKGLSVLYVCPIKALLNNLEQRLSRYAALIGKRVQVWHGDVSQSAKTRSLRDAPDILLTTPESLEGMLISLRVDRPSWFGALRVAIVDELHAFAGDDRGWHLRAVLGRLRAFTPFPIQRIGLSATIGNPDELLRWFTTGEEGVVVGESAPSGDADVTIDYVATLANAATVISRLHRGTKRLVFCDSRARVEELAAALRDLEVRTFVSHSSLSMSERRQAEQAFGEDSNCVIVATSTLELGIDVGDLDYVIQIDAPSTVSSFLQRMGRTGRRSGAKRNCLFLATTEESLLIACGIARLWREGFVEPIQPPPEPWHLVAQQAMALVLQHAGRLELKVCKEQLAALFPELPAAGIQELISFMLSVDILGEQDGQLGFGKRGEKLYGRQHFLDLLSSFASPVQIQVRYGAADLGVVDPMSLRSADGTPYNLLLGGRSWHVVNVDWSKRIAWVEPSREQGKARWLGTSRSLGFALCQGIKGTLCDDRPAVTLSKRAHACMQELRTELPEFSLDTTTVEHLADGRFRWWTFAGSRANATLAEMLHTTSRGVRATDFYLDTSGQVEWQQIGQQTTGTDLTHIVGRIAKSEQLNVKFIDSLPEFAITAMTIARELDARTAKIVVEQHRPVESIL